ncbi:hypothetical protein BJX99DRAFT_259762 [Aspergillus californicus]
MALYSLSFGLLLSTVSPAFAVSVPIKCPPSYVFDEILPLHPSSCSAITLCMAEDGSSHFPTFDNLNLPCPSTLIALQCPEVLELAGSEGVETQCEYSVLRFDQNGFLGQACCETFDLVFRSLDVAPHQRFLRGEFLGVEIDVEDNWEGADEESEDLSEEDEEGDYEEGKDENEDEEEDEEEEDEEEEDEEEEDEEEEDEEDEDEDEEEGYDNSEDEEAGEEEEEDEEKQEL